MGILVSMFLVQLVKARQICFETYSGGSRNLSVKSGAGTVAISGYFHPMLTALYKTLYLVFDSLICSDDLTT